MSVFDLSAWFIAGLATSAIVVAALVASSLIRNGALALAACAAVVLYLAGGAHAFAAASDMLEQQIRAIPEFSHGLVAGLVLSAMLLLGWHPRSS